MRFLASMGMPVPREFQIAAEFAINTELRRLFESEPLDFDRINSLLREAQRSGVTLDSAGLSYALSRTIRSIGERFQRTPGDRNLLSQLDAAVGLARTLPFEVDVWHAQNTYYALLQTVYPQMNAEAGEGYADAHTWLRLFRALGVKLRFRLPPGAP
jgi:hypothetical protein